MLLSRRRFQDNTVVCNVDITALTLDLDGVGTLLACPGEKDVAGSGGQLKRDRCGIFERPFPIAALFERCSDAAGNSGPAHEAIERVPAVIEQDASACCRRIDAPVCVPFGHHSDSRLSAQRLPTDGPYRSD